MNQITNEKEQTDKQPFQDFYSHHASRVFQYCIKRGVPAEISREFTQDIFLSVYINRVYEMPNDQAVPWLFTTTRNRVISHMRSKNRKQGHAGTVEVASHSWNVDFKQPDDLMEEKDQISRLQLIISNAPPMVRKCLILKYFQQLSYEEMASFLGISINTVKTHIKRGLQLLRLQFEG